jgi:aryl-alcohol dehydrogenase-like predicted oxidoreductase
MIYRRIANTDIDVSTICLGTMTFGTPVPAEEAARIVHWAMDHGINFMDTADIYEGYNRRPGTAGGVGESILGDALVGRRSSAVVTTKVGNDVGSGRGLSKVHIHHQIDASLRRLRTDYVDFYELHRPDPETPLEESIATVVELIAAGKVRHWGFSNFDAQQIRQMMSLCDANGWPRSVINQPHYSWLSRDIEAEQLPVCRSENIAITPYRSLEGGLLTGKYRQGQPVPTGSRASESAWLKEPDEGTYSRIEGFIAEAAKRGIDPTRYALQWVLEQPGIASAVVGTKSIAQIESLL